MPCCLTAILALAFPRAAIVFLFFFSSVFERAHIGIVMLILGFLFLPLTTLVYAWVIYDGHSVTGIYLIAVIVAVMADIGLIGGGARARRRNRDV